MNNRETLRQIETVEIIREVVTKLDGSWQPKDGETLQTLKQQVLHSGLTEVEWETIKTEAVSVLSKCVDPTAPPRKETGLVVGYIQSGKTMSFTAVTALARDNGFQMVIVIAGMSLNLRDQSTKRLEDDLDLANQLRLPQSWCDLPTGIRHS